MNRTRRRIIALAAAYVMGLQALLLPLSVAIGASPAGTVCTSSGSPGSSVPSDRSNCPCAAGCGMQCGVHAAAVPPQHVFTLASFGAAASLPRPAIEQAPAPALRGPQLARAPPLA